MAWPYLRYRRYDGIISGDLDVILEAFDGLILSEVNVSGSPITMECPGGGDE